MIPRSAASESASPESRRSRNADSHASSTTVTAIPLSPIAEAMEDRLCKNHDTQRISPLISELSIEAARDVIAGVRRTDTGDRDYGGDTSQDCA